jgi:SAM-dependent methyltransferase
LTAAATERDSLDARRHSRAACNTLFRLLGGYVLPQCIAVAAQLGIADALADGPRRASSLAEETDSDPVALERLLRGLANAGVFAETAPGEFALTPLSQHLRREAEPSLHALAVLTGEVLYGAWGGLRETVRTGTTAFEDVHGRPFYDYLAEHSGAREAANEWMGASGTLWALAGELERAFDWSSVETVVDVGGGTGALLAELLERQPHLQGVLFDRPEVVAAAHELKRRLGRRLRLVGGNFFDSVPGGGDAYLLARVLFNWDDDEAHELLGTCRRAAAEGARLLVLEPFRSADPGPDPGVAMDLANLVLTGGRVRRRDELERLVTAAGFTPVAAHPLVPPWLALEARAS